MTNIQNEKLQSSESLVAEFQKTLLQRDSEVRRLPLTNVKYTQAGAASPGIQLLPVQS